MKKRRKTGLFSLLAAICLSWVVLPGSALAVSDEIDFLSYEEALNYFDFDIAATNWCTNFGLDPETHLDEARAAILAGTPKEFIIRLATYSRDSGHGGEKLAVSNSFRPACYQEVIGLHDSNANTGPFRNAMYWNGKNVVDFWWTCERSEGWPQSCSIDLSLYDLDTLDLRLAYRMALRLWDNTWAANYYAKPGCSAHNSGCAMDIMNYWLGGTFATTHTAPFTGEEFHMEDYGLYKPLQPSNTSGGETWHITCSPSILALGNYDSALNAGYEPVYGIYYNPASRGWSMADGRGMYIGAGVTVIQLRLCQLGLLPAEYVTGFYCARTEQAIADFQAANGLGADGVCGSGTLDLLLPEPTVSMDTEAPVLTAASLGEVHNNYFMLSLEADDNERVNAFRVDTQLEGTTERVSRLYCAQKGGIGVCSVDMWDGGVYEVFVSALDAAGNESAVTSLGTVKIDTVPPAIESIEVYDFTESGFTIEARASDETELAGFRIFLSCSDGTERDELLPTAETGRALFYAEGLGEGEWTITVSALDVAGNERTMTFERKYALGTAMPGARLLYLGPAQNAAE